MKLKVVIILKSIVLFMLISFYGIPRAWAIVEIPKPPKVVVLEPVERPTPPPPSSAEPNWLMENETGCKVWNPEPVPQETVTWTGRCKDGYIEGAGILIWRQNGKLTDTYEGNCVRGKYYGKGVSTLSDGTRYEGDWVNGWFTGYGVLRSADGSIQRGRFQNGEYLGP